MIANRRQSGLSLLEVLISLSVLATVSLMGISYVTTAWRRSDLNRERVFAYERAQSILEELRAIAADGEAEDITKLDAYDDGFGFEYALTVQKDPVTSAYVSPDHAASGNMEQGDDWAFARRVSVQHFAGVDQRDLRLVTVSVHRNETGTPPGNEVATVSSVIRTVPSTHPPTQVFDVYLIAIENVPGWWVNMAAIKPFVESALIDIMTRNSGLEIRTHWITRLSYGRNEQYTPYINDSADSEADIDYAYFYPGKMPSGSAIDYYYVPDRIAGRINVDGIVANGYDDIDNPFPYALADQFNHCMRLADEEALFDARVAAGLEDESEPTWRLLLERMNAEPDRYKNAIIVNLHGELFPMPPIRNFSDAAKEPVTLPNVRVVTHPERLRYHRGLLPVTSEDINLRVYSYKTDPSSGSDALAQPIIVEIPNFDLTSNVNGLVLPSLTIKRIPGGLDLNPVDSFTDAYPAAGDSERDCPVVVGSGPFTPSHTGEMYARVRYDSATSTTVIELHNSPLIAPEVGAQGLNTYDRLYGMDYIPCSTESANDFSVDLANTSDIPKNTARWVLTVPATQLGLSDLRMTVRTRIGRGDGGDTTHDGAAMSTGIMYPPASRVQPDNQSNTYVWWTDSVEDVPYTERYQFIGDPRHCPYADLKQNGVSFADGYNWFFDDFENSSTDRDGDWPGFDPARIKNDGDHDNDGWQHRLELDMPRFYQLLRGGLVESETVYTSLTGWSYYYMGIGNEIGYDSANGFPNSIPVSGLPFGSSTDGYEQAITNSSSTFGSGVKYIRKNASGTYWWGLNWLGELYEDSVYDAQFRVPRYEYSDTLPLPSTLPAPKGNLLAGTASTAYIRDSRQDISVNLPRGTTFEPAERRTKKEGCTSFFNTGTGAGDTFHHWSASGDSGDLTTDGSELAEDYRFPLPDSIIISRPFAHDTHQSGGVGEEFTVTSSYPRYTVNDIKMYYDSSTDASLFGSALLEVRNPAGTSSGYVLVHGLAPTTESGSGLIARYASLSLVHGFFTATDTSLTNSIDPPARIEVTFPTQSTELDDPSSIAITWTSEWARWDSLDYTRSIGAVDFDEGDLEYVLMYSPDDGNNWFHVIDDSVATPGERPSDTSLILADAADDTDEVYTWSVPSSSFPQGAYIVRAECYRVGSQLHFSYHQEKVFIDR